MNKDVPDRSQGLFRPNASDTFAGARSPRMTLPAFFRNTDDRRHTTGFKQ